MAAYHTTGTRPSLHLLVPLLLWHFRQFANTYIK
jgi:hypothetical protein